MKSLQKSLVILVLTAACLLLTNPFAFADTYNLATFTGAVNGGNANDQSPFSAIIPQDNPITGNFVIDNSISVPSSGYWNSSFSTYPDIAEIPAATAFTINLGSLTFTLANAVPGSGAVEYNNGAFVGFAFVADFTYDGHNYVFDDEGGTWSISALNGGVPGQQYVSGYIGSMTLGAPYDPNTPSVPEPSTMLLLGLGLVGLAAYSKLKKA